MTIVAPVTGRAAIDTLDHVRQLGSYVPGKPIAQVAREFGLDPQQIFKLASNENALGPAPAARAKLIEVAGEANLYPDIDCVELREGLSRRCDVPMEQIMVGAGSSELIVLAVHALLDPTRSAIVPEYSFISYELAVRSVGAQTIHVPNVGWQPNLDGLLAAIEPSTRLIFLASPNNPTGIMVEPAEIERFVAAVPAHVLVVLDEAYRDFVPPEHCVDVRALVRRHPNVLVMRTFSKVYGLSGLRVGYGIGDPSVVGILRRLQPPFSVNAQAQAAALAALGDRDFVARSIEMVHNGRIQMSRDLETAGFEYVPSHGNFVLLKVGDGPKVFRHLLQKGIVVRPLANYRMPEWIRVTVGLPEQNAAFIRELRAHLPQGTPR